LMVIQNNQLSKYIFFLSIDINKNQFLHLFV
jgi:hypothetical protein